MPLPFEQQPRESDKAFAAFRMYLEMGPERSLEAVSQKLSKSSRLMKRWSAKYDWTARVQAYGAHLGELERVAIQGLALEKAVEWNKTHEPLRREAWKEAEETIAMVRQAREQWLAKGRTPGWEGMARMLELAFKLKQFAAGMASEITEVQTHVSGSIDLEWQAALEKAYGTKPSQVEGAAVVDVEEVKP